MRRTGLIAYQRAERDIIKKTGAAASADVPVFDQCARKLSVDPAAGESQDLF